MLAIYIIGPLWALSKVKKGVIIMRLRFVSIIVISILFFCVLILYLLSGSKSSTFSERSGVVQKDIIRMSGPLDIRSFTDMRVSGKKIALCGVSFASSKQMEGLMLSVARQALQGQSVDCVQVGGGTPCDGNTAPSFMGTPVVQCFTGDKRDIAMVLSAEGILCDLPAQSAGHYRSCF